MRPQASGKLDRHRAPLGLRLTTFLRLVIDLEPLYSCPAKGGSRVALSSTLKVDCTQTTPKKVYRRRQPEKSVLYRALAQHFESFLLLYEQRFEKSFGYLRAVVRDTVYRFLDCGILESGFVITD